MGLRFGGMRPLVVVSQAEDDPGQNVAPPSVWPLELVMPRAVGTRPSTELGVLTGSMAPTIGSKHRIFFAYTGLAYNIHVVAVGGAYPYTYELTDAPAGMTVDADGVINWPNPTSNATPTITVTDAEDTEVSSAWTIAVSTTNWRFLDAATGSDAGAGTIADPWETIDALQANGTVDTKAYFKNGTYLIEDASVKSGDGNGGSGWDHVDTECPIWIAYPGHSSVVLDHGFIAATRGGWNLRSSEEANACTYVDGINSVNIGNIGHQPNRDYVVFRNCVNEQPSAAIDEGNPGYIMLISGGATYSNYYMVLANMQFVGPGGGDEGGAIKTYTSWKLAILDSSFTDSREAFDLKHVTDRWTVRGCTFDNQSFFSMYGNMHDNSYGELCYSLFLADEEICTLDMGQDGLCTGDIHVYRNTFYQGFPEIRQLDDGANPGPFRLYANVIQRDGDGTKADRIRKLAVSTGSTSYDTHAKVILGSDNGAGCEDNLSGTMASAMLDSAGLLQGASRTTYLGLVGHEIP